MPSQGSGVDLGACEERQEDRPERGQEVDPGRRLEAEDIAAQDAKADFDQGDRDPHSDRDQAGNEGKADPESGNEVGVVHVVLPGRQGGPG